MNVWIERCNRFGQRLSWECVASLVKEAHRNGDANLTEREIDLAYSLKDKQVSMIL